MDDTQQKDVFRRNLLRYLGDTPQAEVAKTIGVSPQTFNTWCQGKAMPRAGKLQSLADYFGINKSDLIEESTKKVDPVLQQHIANYSHLPTEWQMTIDELVKALQEEPQDTDKVWSIFQKISKILQS